MQKHSARVPGLIVLLAFAIAIVGASPANAQAVPAGAREAATSPRFADRLLHASSQRRAPNLGRGGACPMFGNGADNNIEPMDFGGLAYANGPVNGICDIQHCSVEAWTINYGYAVSNSVPVFAQVQGLTIAVWLFPGDTLQSVDWAVGTHPFASDIASGRSSAASQFLTTNQYGYNIYQVQLDLNAYFQSGNWLTLRNATTPNRDPVFWDENAGPSLAKVSGPSSIGTVPSESFNLSGDTGSGCMPEQQGQFKVLHDFTGGDDGAVPVRAVIDRAGNLYGLAQGGNGSIFKMAEEGSGWTLSTLYNFPSDGAGGFPRDLILGPDGVLYGAAYGGLLNCPSGADCGFVFDLRPGPTACFSTSCSWWENVLYSFTGATDAWRGTNLVADRQGNLYGVSYSGGAQQQGAVFELMPTIGGWSESILYSFTGGSDGGSPTDLIIGRDGNLFGTTALGGANNMGVVFQLSYTAQGWTESALFSFQNQNYSNPHSLLQDSAGNLFGENTDVDGSGDAWGIVYMLTPSNGQWVYTQIHQGVTGQGQDVFANLIMDPNGTLYGTGGGSFGCINAVWHGYIFELQPVEGGWQYSTPNSWQNTQFRTDGRLALDPQNNLYGTTTNCGAYNNGTVWELSH